MKDEITYPFLIFTGCTVGFIEWISNFITHFITNVIIYPSYSLRLFRVTKKGPSWYIKANFNVTGNKQNWSTVTVSWAGLLHVYTCSKSFQIDWRRNRSTWRRQYISAPWLPGAKTWRVKGSGRRVSISFLRSFPLHLYCYRTCYSMLTFT